MKGAQGACRCSLRFACEVCLRQCAYANFSRCNFVIPAQLEVSTTRVHIGGQNGDAIRAVPAKNRLANTEHEPLAFEC